MIKIVNISNNRIEHKIKNNKIDVVCSFLQLRDGNILCGCDDGLICLYDITLQKLFFNNDITHDGIIFLA